MGSYLHGEKPTRFFIFFTKLLNKPGTSRIPFPTRWQAANARPAVVATVAMESVDALPAVYVTITPFYYVFMTAKSYVDGRLRRWKQLLGFSLRELRLLIITKQCK